jgi:hypothetical protein
MLLSGHGGRRDLFRDVNGPFFMARLILVLIPHPSSIKVDKFWFLERVLLAAIVLPYTSYCRHVTGFFFSVFDCTLLGLVVLVGPFVAAVHSLLWLRLHPGSRCGIGISGTKRW